MRCDPIGRFGGLNLYAMIDNEPISKFDWLGLRYYGLPKTAEKCRDIGNIMAFAATASGPVNYQLWMHWLGGNGNSLDLGYSSFDLSGSCRGEARRLIYSLRDQFVHLANTRNCGQSATLSRSFSSSCSSVNLMINRYTQTTSYEVTMTKKCDSIGCCDSLEVSVSWKNTASDRTDFNPGQIFRIPPHTIEDELVNQCFHTGNNDFDISAEESNDNNWSFPCPN